MPRYPFHTTNVAIFPTGIAAVLICAAVGCRVAGTAFEIDSDNPSPRLGLTLAPRKADEDRTAVSERDDDTTPKGSDHLQASAETATVPDRTSWTGWLGGLNRPKRIPLPLSTTPAETSAAEEAPQSPF